MIKFEILTFALSCFAIIISGLTLFFVNFWGGKVSMVKPSQIWFGYTAADQKGAAIFLKSLIYSSGLQGRVIESMYVKLTRGESKQVFNIWNIGPKANMYRPGGLRVNKEGYLGDHVFLLPTDSQDYSFKDGEYLLEIFARIAGDKTPARLNAVKIAVPPNLAKQASETRGIYFDLHSNASAYVVSLDEQPEDQEKKFFDTFEKLGATLDKPTLSEEMLIAIKNIIEATNNKNIETKK